MSFFLRAEMLALAGFFYRVPGDPEGKTAGQIFPYMAPDCGRDGVCGPLPWCRHLGMQGGAH